MLSHTFTITACSSQKHLIVDKLKHKNTGVDVLKVYEIQGITLATFVVIVVTMS